MDKRGPGAGGRLWGQQVWGFVRQVGFGVGCGPWSAGSYWDRDAPGKVQTLMEAAYDRQKAIEVNRVLPGEGIEHF